MDLASPRAERTFSINEGGPFYHLMRLLHLVRPTGVVRVWWIVLVMWLPLVTGAGLRAAFGMQLDPIIYDISVHTRLLLGLPLLFVASQLLEPQCRGAVLQLYGNELADRGALDSVIDRAERLRDSAWAEAVLAGIALLLGQFVLWEVSGPTGLVSGISHASWSFSRVWYAVLTVPLLQFLVLRWLWRWSVWTYVLVRVSRLPLVANATHADHAGGLGFLSWPLGGFTWFVVALATVLAGAWGTQLLDHRITIPALPPTLLTFLAIVLVIGCGPLLLFCSHAYRMRRQALAAYGLFNYEYARQFQAKWIDGKPSEPLLGTADIQSFADLGNVYQTIATTRIYVFSLQQVRSIIFAVLIPMVPLIATTVPIEHVVDRLGSAVLGLLPL